MGQMEKVGEYAFIAFVIIAIIGGLYIGYLDSTYDHFTPYTNVKIDGPVKDPTLYQVPEKLHDTLGIFQLVLVILGIICGIATVTEKEATAFLIAAIALAVVRGAVFLPLNYLAPLGYMAMWIVNFIATFVAPAAIIIAVKAVWALARTK